jgi:hypothetical protein
MDFTPSGDSLVVVMAGARSLAIIDLRDESHPVSVVRLSVLDTVIPPASAMQPGDVNVTANGKAFVLMWDSWWADKAVLELDLRTRVQRMRSDARVVSSGGTWTSGTTYDKSQAYYFFGHCSWRYLASSDSFTACKRTGFDANSASVDRGAQHFTYGNILFDAQMDSVGVMGRPVVGFAEKTYPVAVSPDGTRAFAALPGVHGLTIAETTRLRYVERIPLSTPVAQILFSPDGTRAIALERLNPETLTRVHVIDLR